MPRRIAPNLLNTLADPAEFGLRLFYRGHESAAKGDPAPDPAKHGPVQYDDHYRCVFWLDEHEHAAAAASAAQAKTDADTAAGSAKTAEAAASTKAATDKTAATQARAAAEAGKGTPQAAQLEQEAVAKENAATESETKAREALEKKNAAEAKAKALQPEEIAKARAADAVASGNAAAASTQEKATAKEAEDAAAKAEKEATQAETAAQTADAAAQKAATEAAAKPAGAAGSAEAQAKQTADQAAATAKTKATEERTKADAAKAKADDLRAKATAAKTKSATAESKAKAAQVKASNEPKPLAKDTEILKKDKNKKYRLVITDNHGATDKTFTTTGKSKVEWYSDPFYKWMRDVRPAVPFEAVLTKKSDGKQIAFGNDDVRVVWKIIDPAEELDVVDLGPGGASKSARPKAWLKRFFGTGHFQNPDSADATNVNDNCPDTFGGLRTVGGCTPATKVFVKAPFATDSPKPLDAAPAPDAAVGAVSAVEPAEDDAHAPIGRSPVFFHPLPIGGDNFRFRLSLVDKDGKPVKFRDHENKLVDSLETGPITIWRRVVIDLLVTFDSVDQTGINWEEVRQAYRPGFIDIVGPILTKVNDRASWTAKCKAYFKRAGNGVSADEVDCTGAFAGKTPYNGYDKHLVPSYNSLLPIIDPALITSHPDFVNKNWSDRSTTAGPPYDINASGQRTAQGNAKIEKRWTITEGLAKEFLDAAYEEFGRPNARADTKQEGEQFGFSVFFAKRPMEWSTVLGQYMFGREFQFVLVGDVTCTFAHELGHAVNLFHSWTVFSRASGPAQTWYTYISEGASQVRDHDQNDALVCTMAYENDYYKVDAKTVRGDGVRWHFCAVCLLKLRFWDLNKLQNNSRVMKWIHEGLYRSSSSPVKITDLNYEPFTASNNHVAKDGRLVVAALAGPEALNNNSGGPFGKDISKYQMAAWSFTRADLVQMALKPSAGDYWARQYTMIGSNVAAASGDARTVEVKFALPPDPPPLLLAPPEDTTAPDVKQEIKVNA